MEMQSLLHKPHNHWIICIGPNIILKKKNVVDNYRPLILGDKIPESQIGLTEIKDKLMPWTTLFFPFISF